MTLHQTRRELHHQRLDGVRTGPATWCQQLHANGTAVHDVALFDSRLNDPHEGWRKWEILRETELQGDVRNVQLDHVLGELGFGIDDMETGVPFVEVVVDQFYLKTES